MESSPVKIATTERTHEQRAQASHPGREGGHSASALDRQSSGFHLVRRTSTPPHRLLPLAKAVLCARGGGLRTGATCLQAGRGPRDAHDIPGSQAEEERRGAGGADGRARGPKKKSWGDLKSQWVPHDTRDQVIDFVRRWNERTEIATQR